MPLLVQLTDDAVRTWRKSAITLSNTIERITPD